MSERLHSMTGYARTEQVIDGWRIAWDVKCVNAKGLDVRLRLPSGLDRLDGALRDAAKGQMHRGSVQAGLTIETVNGDAGLAVDRDRLAAVLALHDDLAGRMALGPSTLEGILSIKGVMVETTASTLPDDLLNGSVVEVFRETLGSLNMARAGEGRRIGAVLLDHLATIEDLAKQAAGDPSLTQASIAERLREQVSRLLDGAPGLDDDRLMAEAAILATKADIREEIDRLSMHVSQARDLLKAGGPIGRRLDFLAQEFNREANTLCSKSNAASVTRCGLDLKVAIDQFREQVQNLE